MEIVKRHKVGVSLFLVLALALLLRVWGIGYDLPYIYHPDEPVNILVIQNLFKTGEVGVDFYYYPTLFYYINAFAYVPYYLIGKLSGSLHTPQDIAGPVSLVLGVTQTSMPGAVLAGRLVTVLLGLGGVWLIFVAGKWLTGRFEVGALAALLMAVSPTYVWHDRWIAPDTFATFFALATLVASIWVLQRGTAWAYIVAGVCAAFTAANKYNGGVVALTPIAAHFLRCGKQGFKDGKLYLVLASIFLAFVLTNPYVILEYDKFLSGLDFNLTHYSSGHEGQEGDSLRWYLAYLVRTMGVVAPLALWQMARGVYGRKKEILLVAVFPVCYLLMIARFVVRNDRTIMPMTPFLLLLAAWLLVEFLIYAWQGRAEKPHGPLLALSGVLITAALLFPAAQTLRTNVQLSQTNSREAARVWINTNLPPGARIALEAYAPFVDTERFSVQAVSQVIEHDPQWYVDNGFDYLVFSEIMFGRFYQEPDKYQAKVQQYDEFFRRFTLEQLFDAHGNEVRVYRVEDDR